MCTVSESVRVQMACYFDLKEDLDWATSSLQRASRSADPDHALKVEEPVGENGHLVLASVEMNAERVAR